MAVMTPTQTEQVRQWATANGLNPGSQVQEAEKLLQSGAYSTFDALAQAASMKRVGELSSPDDVMNTEVNQKQMQFYSQPADAQMNQIRAWFSQNPNANQAQIQSAMDEYGVAPRTVALAMGNTRLPNAPAAIQVAQYENITGNRSDINDINRATVARNLGVSAEELSSMGGMNLAQAQALTGRAAEQNPLGGQVSTDQIRAYVAANPNVSDQQLAAMMTQYGVTPTQVSQATGVDVGQIQARLGNAVQAGAENIPTGLAGFEQALTSGLATATGTLQGAETAARADLTPAMEEVARLYGLNVDDLRTAGQVARGDIERTYGQAGGLFTPYQQAGTTALQQQLALSGALGQDAFNAAYQESPYIQFLREQGERSTLSGAAATGGLGGGRVQQELVRFGQGLAGQGLQQQIQNLSGLSGQGMQAAGAGADIFTGMGTSLANLGAGTAQNIAGQRQGLASERSAYGVNLANLASSTGSNIANLQAQAAQNTANQRARAGELLAAQISGTTTNLADLSNAQGANLANAFRDFGTAGLNLSQGYTAGQIAAIQQAAADEANAQQNYGVNTAAALSGQPFMQQQPYNYGQAFGNALQAGALGYDLGGGGRPAGSEYTRPTQLPPGSQVQPVGQVQPQQNNFLYSSMMARNLGR
jgi:uncharacterized protein YneF (UPF0154 family)